MLAVPTGSTLSGVSHGALLAVYCCRDAPRSRPRSLLPSNFYREISPPRASGGKGPATRPMWFKRLFRVRGGTILSCACTGAGISDRVNSGRQRVSLGSTLSRFAPADLAFPASSASRSRIPFHPQRGFHTQCAEASNSRCIDVIVARVSGAQNAGRSCAECREDLGCIDWDAQSRISGSPAPLAAQGCVPLAGHVARDAVARCARGGVCVDRSDSRNANTVQLRPMIPSIVVPRTAEPRPVFSVGSLDCALRRVRDSAAGGRLSIRATTDKALQHRWSMECWSTKDAMQTRTPALLEPASQRSRGKRLGDPTAAARATRSSA